MALTQTNIKSRLVAAYQDPDLPADVKEYLKGIRETYPLQAGVTQAQIANSIDAFLDTDPETWDLETTQVAVSLILRNWDKISA